MSDFISSYLEPIELTLNNTTKKVLLDNADYYKARDLQWSINGGTVQAWDKFKKRRTTMSVFLLGKPPDGYIWDHKDRNFLNNRRENLRLATHKQNCRNTSKRKSSASSRYRGVSYHIKYKKWRASIRFNNKQIWLGLFETEEAAAIAYNTAAIRYHGEFASINQLEEANGRLHQQLPPTY